MENKQTELKDNIEQRIKDMISYIFGKYDMRKGKSNEFRMKKLLEFCMDDIRIHPSLKESLKTKESLEFFVTQSIIYMVPIV
ncbi:hypothetical protein [Clostridium sp.]|uniref:hypothetical protein n=1 Tax=Clostridium sp. TaxID=1506 RepID=UPI0032167689